MKNQPPEFWDQSNFNYPDKVHIRIHPLLGWTEIDIWNYIKDQNIPIVNLYFSKNGKRYRSLGDKDITFPVISDAKTLDEIIHELPGGAHRFPKEQASILKKSIVSHF